MHLSCYIRTGDSVLLQLQIDPFSAHTFGTLHAVLDLTFGKLLYECGTNFNVLSSSDMTLLFYSNSGISQSTEKNNHFGFRT